MNLCRACGKDFSGVSTFDLHRVGKHDYTYSEGLHMDPMREDGRRCLSTDELYMRGLRLDSRGRWCDPSRSPAARLGGPRNATEAFL